MHKKYNGRRNYMHIRTKNFKRKLSWINYKWQDLTKPYKTQELKLIIGNEEILVYKYDNSHYTVTDTNIEHTPIIEGMIYPEFNFYLEKLLVYYYEMNK